MWALILLPAEREFPEPDLRTKWFYDFGFLYYSSTPSRTAT
ncbi:hypothetical protein [Levilactobacillus brevis]|nr:hypothetical protein [Levilactobacillus brevis]AJA80656.1 hypothetical protein L747_01420 [Levilactobacillus brevis BSO 464]